MNIICWLRGHAFGRWRTQVVKPQDLGPDVTVVPGPPIYFRVRICKRCGLRENAAVTTAYTLRKAQRLPNDGDTIQPGSAPHG